MAKELWELARGAGGRPKIIETPEDMWDLAVEYFNWCKEKTISEEKIFKVKHGESDVLEHDYLSHERPMSLRGLCVVLGISVSSWYDYKKRDEFLEVITSIEDVMFEQKFSGAAVGRFNANIISRDLGLADRAEVATYEVKKANENEW